MSYDVSLKVGKRTYSAKDVETVEEGKREISKKLNNQKKYLKGNGNWVRVNKEDSSFSFVNTTQYNSLLEEWRDYYEYAYTSCGLNVLEREMAIIDCDDSDFGEKMVSLINKTPIIFNYVRRKPNGHSQIGIFLKKVVVRNRSFKRRTVCQSEVFTSEEWEFAKTFIEFLQKDIILSPKINENTIIDVNRLYLTTVRLLNNNFNGDLGFTGFCCQNAYSNADGATTEWMDKEHCYSLGSLFCTSLKYALDKEFNFKKKSAPKSAGLHTQNDYIIVEKENVDNMKKSLAKLSKKFDTAFRKSIDFAIFEFVCGLKSYCYRNKIKTLSYEFALKSIKERKDITKDYDECSIEQHTINAVDYVNEHFNPKKNGLSREQKMLGKYVKKAESLLNWLDVMGLKEGGLSRKEIAKKTNLCERQVQRLSHKTIEDFDIEAIEKSIKNIKKYQDLYGHALQEAKKMLTAEESEEKPSKEKRMSVADLVEKALENGNKINPFTKFIRKKEIEFSCFVKNI